MPKPLKKTLRLPIQNIDGHWELLLGGAIKLKDRALAELIVSADDLADRDRADPARWAPRRTKLAVPNFLHCIRGGA